MWISFCKDRGKFLCLCALDRGDVIVHAGCGSIRVVLVRPFMVPLPTDAASKTESLIRGTADLPIPDLQLIEI